MTEQEMVEFLLEALFVADEDGDLVSMTRTFEECGLLTMNKGVVVRTHDGSEFQLQVVKSQ